ncbi:proton-conducting transporter membrane subunit [Natrialbaceae archaeon GCM10025810]|uniref:proton-conducting transporter transmembrane domain-containing protein n=1 Tax=Halovalidus salilacus TaxID=3075124 RepID=UPI003614AB7B
MAEVITDIRPLAAVLVSAVTVLLIVASHRHPNVREAWSVLAALTKFGLVASMVPGVLEGTVYEFEVTGQFVEGVGFVLRADPLGTFFALLSSFLWIFTAFYATGYMRGLDEHAQTRFFAAFAASLSSAVGIAFAGNLLTIFVFYELLSLVTYPLVAHNEDAEARAAGRKYVAYTFFGGGVLVLAGTALVYWLTASAEAGPTLAFEAGGMSALAEVATADPVFAQAAFFLLVTGFGVKAAVMPLHSWLADAMVAPTPVSGLLHAVAVVKSGAFGVSRVFLHVFGPGTIRDLPLSIPGVGEVGLNVPVAVAAAFTLTAASIIAMRKDHLKRRLAYSTTAQLSYIVLGLSLLHPWAVFGALFHIPAHAFGKLTLFFCAGAVHVETHTDYISEMAGIGKRMPLTMAAFTVGAAGMAGMPLVAGFVSKFYMLIGALELGGYGWVFALSLLVSGVLNIAYFWPVVYTAFFESEERHDAKPLLEFPLGGERRSYAADAEAESEPVAADGGEAEREGQSEDAATDAPDGGEHVGDGDDYEYAVDRYPSDHTVADADASDTVEGEHVDVVDHHGDHDDAHTGGPPASGWERRSPFAESTWLMLLPIAVIATGAVVLGVVPDHAVFLDLANVIVEAVTGEVILG